MQGPSLDTKMKYLLTTAILFFVTINNVGKCFTESIYAGIVDPPEPVALYPTVVVGLLVRNKAHTLPYFLHYLENLDYPKERMTIW